MSPTLTDDFKRQIGITDYSVYSDPFEEPPIDVSLFAVLDRKTFGTAFQEVAERPYKILPYINAISLVEEGRVFRAANAAQAGTITPEEDRFLNRYLADRQRESSFGYKVANMALNIVPYALEFASGGAIIKGGATAVVKGAGAAGTKKAVQELTKKKVLGRIEEIGARSAARLFPNVAKNSAGFKIASALADDTGGALAGGYRAIREGRIAGKTAEELNVLRKTMFKSAGKHLGSTLMSSVPRTILQPHRVADQTIHAMTPQYALTHDQQGNLKRVLVEEADGITKALIKGFGDVYIENFSETTGENLFLLRGLAGKEAKDYVAGAYIAKIFDKAEKGLVARGINIPAARKIVAKHFLGDADNPGILLKFGVSSVFGELFEEAVGGTLRQVTGLSPLGLPDLDDVAAMALGFMLNPISIGAYSSDVVMTRLYGDRIRETTAAGEEYINAGKKGELFRDKSKIGNFRNQVRKTIEYFQKSEQLRENKGNLMDRFARFMWLDNVERKIIQKAYPSISDERVLFNARALEAGARNTLPGEVSNEMVDNLIEYMSGTRAVDVADISSLREAANVQDLVPDQFTEEGTLTGYIPRGLGEASAPWLLVGKGVLPKDALNELKEKYSFLVNEISISDMKSQEEKEGQWLENQFSADHFRVVSRDDPIPVDDINDKNLHFWAKMLGVEDVSGDHVFRDRFVLRIRSTKTSLAEVKRRASRINTLAKQTNEKIEYVVTPSMLMTGTPEEFVTINQAIEGKPGERVTVNIGAHWDSSAKRIYLTPTAEFTDIAEDTIESILKFNAGKFQADDTAEALLKLIRNAIKDHPTAPKFSDIELLSKTLKVLLFGQETGPRDLAFFVLESGVSLSKEGNLSSPVLSGWIKDLAIRQGFDPAILDTISGGGSNYDNTQEFVHLGYTQKNTPDDIAGAGQQYAQDKQQNDEDFDNTFSLGPHAFDPDRYGQPENPDRDDGTLATWKFIHDRFRDDPEVDEIEFTEALIDAHGPAILPYVVQYFKDLEAGVIKINNHGPALIAIERAEQIDPKIGVVEKGTRGRKKRKGPTTVEKVKAERIRDDIQKRKLQQILPGQDIPVVIKGEEEPLAEPVPPEVTPAAPPQAPEIDEPDIPKPTVSPTPAAPTPVAETTPAPPPKASAEDKDLAQRARDSLKTGEIKRMMDRLTDDPTFSLQQDTRDVEYDPNDFENPEDVQKFIQNYAGDEAEPSDEKFQTTDVPGHEGDLAENQSRTIDDHADEEKRDSVDKGKVYYGSENTVDEWMGLAKGITAVIDAIAAQAGGFGLEVGPRFLDGLMNNKPVHNDPAKAKILMDIWNEHFIANPNPNFRDRVNKAMTIWKNLTRAPLGVWQYVFRNGELNDEARVNDKGKEMLSSFRANKSPMYWNFRQKKLLPNAWYNGTEYSYLDVEKKRRNAVLGTSWIVDKLNTFARDTYGEGTWGAIEGAKSERLIIDVGWIPTGAKSSQRLPPQVYSAIRSYEYQKALREKDKFYKFVIGRQGEKNLFLWELAPLWTEKSLNAIDPTTKISMYDQYERHYEATENKDMMIPPGYLRSKKMTLASKNDAINQFRWVRRLYGSHDTFENMDDMIKRTSQIGTPGIKIEGKFKRIVFRDYGLTDGALFMNADTFATLLEQQHPSFFPPGETTMAKIFFTAHNRKSVRTTENGLKGEELITSKPMAFNIDELGNDHRFGKIRALMEHYGVMFEAESSMKLRGGQNKDTQVQYIDIFKTEGEGENKKPVFDKNGELIFLTPEEIGDILPKVIEHDSEKGDLLIFTGNPQKIDNKLSAKDKLRQTDSAYLFLPDRERDAIANYENLLFIKGINRVLRYMTPEDFIPYEDSAEDNSFRYGNLQKRLRDGHNFDTMAFGLQRDVVERLMVRSLYSNAGIKLPRIVTTAVPPGKSNIKDFRPEGDHFSPGSLAANIPGVFYTEDSQQWNTVQELEDYLLSGFDDTHDRIKQSTNGRYAWMFETGEDGRPLKRVNLNLIIKDSDGRYRMSGNIGIASRIPFSALYFGLPITADARLGKGKVSGSVIAPPASERTGEDQDGDVHHINMLMPNEHGVIDVGDTTLGLRNRIMLLMFKAHAKYRPETEEAFFNTIDFFKDEELDTFIEEQKEVEREFLEGIANVRIEANEKIDKDIQKEEKSLKAKIEKAVSDGKSKSEISSIENIGRNVINQLEKNKVSTERLDYLPTTYIHSGVSGQETVIRVTTAAKEALGIFAASAGVTRAMNVYGLTFKGLPKVLDKKLGIKVSRTKEDLKGFDLEQQLAFDHEYMDWMTQLMVDDIKNPRAYYMGVSKHTAPLMVLLFLSGTQHRTRDARKDYKMRIVKFLRSPMMMRFHILSRKVDDPSDEMVMDNPTRRDPDVRRIMEKEFPGRGKALMDLIGQGAEEMLNLQGFINQKYAPEKDAYKRYELDRISEQVMNNKLNTIDTSGFLTNKKLVRWLKSVDYLSQGSQKLIWNKDIMFSPMVDGYIQDQYDLENMKHFKRREIYVLHRENATAMSWMNAISQGDPTILSNSIAAIEEAKKQFPENEFLNALDFEITQIAGGDYVATDVSLNDTFRSLREDSSHFGSLVDAANRLPEDTLRSLIAHSVRKWGAASSTKSGNFRNFLSSTYMGAKIDFEIFHETMKRWQGDVFTQEEREIVRNFMSDKTSRTSNWRMTYVPMPSVMDMPVPDSIRGALSEEQNAILDAANVEAISDKVPVVQRTGGPVVGERTARRVRRVIDENGNFTEEGIVEDDGNTEDEQEENTRDEADSDTRTFSLIVPEEEPGITLEEAREPLMGSTDVAFTGQLRFLSNFAPSLLPYEGEVYPTVEHAFQAAKTNDPEEKIAIREANTPGLAKRLGRRVSLRPDWEQVKVQIMTDLVRLKFEDPGLREQLIGTGDAFLSEVNTHGDTTWGQVRASGGILVGENLLGKILMKFRSEITGEPVQEPTELDAEELDRFATQVIEEDPDSGFSVEEEDGGEKIIRVGQATMPTTSKGEGFAAGFSYDRNGMIDDRFTAPILKRFIGQHGSSLRKWIEAGGGVIAFYNTSEDKQLDASVENPTSVSEAEISIPDEDAPESKLTFLDKEVDISRLETRDKGEIVLTDNQLQSQRAIMSWFESVRGQTGPHMFVLKGYAGTGKTSSILRFIRSLEEVNASEADSIGYAAPTHKAARVLRRIIGKHVSTISSILQERPDETILARSRRSVFRSEGDIIGDTKILIIDEASMIQPRQFEQIRAAADRGTRIIFMGDPMQVRPVRSQRSLVFTSGLPEFELTELVRQTAGNPLIKFLTGMRQIPESEIKQRYFPEDDFATTSDGRISEGIKVGTEVQRMRDVAFTIFSSDNFKNDINFFRIIAYRNEVIDSLNERIRNMLFPEAGDGVVPGELITGYGNHSIGEKRVVENSADYMVEEVGKIQEERGIRYQQVKMRNVDEQISEAFTDEDARNMISYGASQEEIDAAREQSQDQGLYEVNIVLNDIGSVTAFTEQLDLLQNSAAEIAKTGDRDAIRAANLDVADFRAMFLSRFDPKILDLDGKEVSIAKKAINNGYAITTHKAQGSTFHTVMTITADLNTLWATRTQESRELVYTAMSRASKRVYSIGSGARDEPASKNDFYKNFSLTKGREDFHSQNTPEHLRVLGGLDERPYMDYWGTFSMRPIQAYSKAIPMIVDSPAGILHDTWWKIRNIMSTETIIGRQYATRQLAAAGGIDARSGLGWKYEKEGDEYGVYDLDEYSVTMVDGAKKGSYKEVGRFNSEKEAGKAVRRHNRSIRKYRISQEDKELAYDVMKWATAEREGIDEIVEGINLYPEDHEIPHLRGQKIVNYLAIDGDEVVFTSTSEFLRNEYVNEQAQKGVQLSRSREYDVKKRPTSEVRDRFIERYGQEEADRRFTQIMELIDEAMRQRERIEQEMRDIAGPNWISHWEFDETGRPAKNYIPHLYKRSGKEFAVIDSKGEEVFATQFEEEARDYSFSNSTEDNLLTVIERSVPLTVEDKTLAISAFSRREETRRIEKRSFKDYLEAATVRGLEPVTTRADELTEHWFTDVWGAAVTRTMISLGSIMPDVDGSPLWIPVFNEDVVNDVYETRIAMSDGFITRATENLLDYVNMLRLQEGQGLYTPSGSKKGKAIINQIINENGSMLDRQGYGQFQSRFKSISHWMVKTRTGVRGITGRTEQENILRMLEERPSEHPLLAGVERFNNWSKNIGLGLSGFHPAALWESLVAIGGFASLKSGMLMPNRMSTKITNARRRALSDPDLLRKWGEAGMRVDPTNPNFQQNKIFQDLQAVKSWGVPGLTQLATAWEGYNKWMTRWMWSEFFPGVKFYSAEILYEEMKENYKEREVDHDDFELRQDISKLVNDAFGGQNWDQYIWATPRRQRLLHLMMFAPDWTISAFNVSGASNIPLIRDIIREKQGPVQTSVEMNKYWPAMAAIVMTGIPQAVQLALYSVAKALPGDDDDEAVPFLFQNEPGKRGIFETGIGGHIDVTPVLKKLGWVPIIGYEGGRTHKRRVYMRWGKQANEVFEGWATRPWTTFANKTSAASRTVFEQLTGYNTAQWELGFKDQPLMGLFQGEKGLMDSRISYLGRKFVPMSILSVMDGRPTTFFAPASRGMSNYTAQTKLAELISTYADSDTWHSLKGSKENPVNLAALGIDILEAAERNGHNSELILSSARRHVLSHLYREFFDQLNADDYKGMDKTAQRILRVNSGLDDALKSMQNRFKQVNRKFTPELKEAVHEVFRETQGLPDPSELPSLADLLVNP